LARNHRVHVACFARNEREVEQARQLREWCASVHVELVDNLRCLASAGFDFWLRGRSLNYGYYRSKRFSGAVNNLTGLDAAIVYSVVMEQFVPAGVPYLLDMIDVDSEKWNTFGQTRFPGFFFRTEAGRLRRREIDAAGRARVTYLATPNERDIFRRIARTASPVESMENGVDATFYDPEAVEPDPALKGRRFLVFTGAFNSFANADGAIWFVREVLPGVRQAFPGLELFIVGMNPTAEVRALASKPGVTVTGYVPDTRAYLLGAQAVIAPLRVARGIQNKVLEGLSMDKPVLVSPEVAATFGGAAAAPEGVIVCGQAATEWVDGLRRCGAAGQPGGRRQGMVERYSWRSHLTALHSGLEALRVDTHS